MNTKVVLIIAGVLCASFIAGYIVGQIKSPKYEQAEICRSYIFNNTKCTYQEDKVTLQFACGTRVYSYDIAVDSVWSSYIPSEQWANIRHHKKGIKAEIKDLMLLFFGGTQFVNLAGGFKIYDYTAILSKGAKVKVLIFTGVATVSGFIVGLLIGYDNVPDCDSNVFQKVLNDKELWRALAAYHKPKQPNQKTSVVPNIIHLGSGVSESALKNIRASGKQDSTKQK